MAYIDGKWAHSSAKGLVSLMMQQLPMLKGSRNPLTLKLSVHRQLRVNSGSPGQVWSGGCEDTGGGWDHPMAWGWGVWR